MPKPVAMVDAPSIPSTPTYRVSLVSLLAMFWASTVKYTDFPSNIQNPRNHSDHLRDDGLEA